MRVDLKNAASRIIKRALKHSTKFALAAALVPLGSVTAEAAIYSSRVEGTVTTIADGFLYEFEVFNTSPFFSAGTNSIIVDWELPLFSLDDVNVNSITSPSGWTYNILNSWVYDTGNDPVLAGDPGIYGPNPEAFETAPYIIHWVVDFDLEPSSDAGINNNGPIFPEDSLAGFSFESAYNSQNAPYLTSWEDLPPITGDPPIPPAGFGTPFSPARQAAQAVPEPASLVVFAGLGFVGLLCGVARSRRKRSD